MEYAYSQFLVIVPNRWGRGPTPEQAALQLRKAGGRLTGEQQWFQVVPGTVVEEIYGEIRHPRGFPPQPIKKPKLAKGWQNWKAE